MNVFYLINEMQHSVPLCLSNTKFLFLASLFPFSGLCRLLRLCVPVSADLPLFRSVATLNSLPVPPMPVVSDEGLCRRLRPPLPSASLLCCSATKSHFQTSSAALISPSLSTVVMSQVSIPCLIHRTCYIRAPSLARRHPSFWVRGSSCLAMVVRKQSQQEQARL